MNQIINNSIIGLNKVGGVFYDYAASVFIQTALLVILLFIIDLLLRKRIRAIFRYCLWLLVIVKLILPPTLSLPTGIGYWTSDRLDVVSSRAFDAVGFEHTTRPSETSLSENSKDPTDGGPLFVPANSTLTPVTWQAVLFVLWLIGVLAFLALLVQRARFVRGLIATSEPAKGELLAILEQSRRQVGLRWDISLRTAETIPSPAVCGFFRPIILIPNALVEKLSPEALRATLIHELAHIKRYDLWVNSIQTFLQIVYFYNPFVWLANSIIRKVCEEAVDETVLVTLGGQAKDYSNTLIDIGETVFWRADLGLRLIGVAESKKALQWRIRHMLTRPIPKSSKLGVVGIAVLFAIASILLPMAKAEKPNKDNKPLAIDNKGKPTKLLYQAAANGDIVQVKNLVAQGADVNVSDGHEEWTPWTPLLAAADGGHAQVVKLLLENGAKPDVGDSLGLTPLHHAIFNEDEETVRTLISGGADVNRRPNKDDDPPLFYAVWQFHAVVKTLIDAGADVNAEGVGNGWTPLHNALQWAYADVARQFIGTGINIPAFQNAVLEGDLNKIRQIVESGTDVDARDKFGWTPAYWALSAGQKEVAEYLLSKGADVTAKTNDGCTLLHQASKVGFVDIVRQLIASGADVNAATAETGRQPLADAAGYGHGEIVRLLVAKGADVNAAFSRGRHPLGEAALAGHEEVVKLLIAGGADVNLNTEGRGTPLHAAANGGHTKIVDMLIANGADVNLSTRNGTPLHRAAYGLPKVKDDTSAEIVEKLLAKGADVNSKDPRQGRTPLHQAAYRGRYKTAELLIAAGANVNATDNEGKTPLSYAKGLGRTDIVELLRKHRAEDDTPTGNNNDKPLQSLHEAAARGEIERVKALIATGAPINAKDEQGRTPLHRAAKLGRKAVVEYLLAQGADVNEAAPLHRAVAYGQKDVVKVLLDNGANVNAFDGGWAPLHYAAFYGYTELLALLIDNGADVNARMKSEQWKGWTALQVAGRYGGSIDVVEHLIDNGADINSRDDGGNTSLHTAVRWARRSEVVELLLNKGADVNARNNMGQTPLHVGPLRDIPLDVEKVQVLMARGADVSAKDQNGRTPLHHAAGNGFVEIVQSMITAGADVNAKTNDGIAPIDEALRIPGTIQPRLGVRCRQLDVADLLLANGADVSTMNVAAYAGDLDKVKELLENGVSVNAKHASNLMPLHTAVSGGHEEVVAFLIAKGADVKGEGHWDRTPLHYAAIAGHSEVAKLLIAHGAEVNVVKKEGDGTILQDAVFYCHTDVAKVLLDNGADVNKRDGPNDRAPLHSAMDGGSIEMVKLLIDRGADVNPDAQYGATPLHRAVAYGHRDIAELLISEGADVNARGRRLGNTPLDAAVRFNKKEMAELLLAKGADINLADNEGITPLWRAKHNNYTEIVELLEKHGAKEDSAAGSDSKQPPMSLYEAVSVGDIEQVKQLITKGADVNTKGIKGKTPLLHAASAGHLDIVKVLLESGADVDVGGGKFTPLFHPIWDDNIDIEMVRTLIASGADVNAHPKGENTTPLFYAVYYNRPQVARILIEAGADVNARSNDGLTPLHVALRRANAEMTRQFAGTGVKIPAFHNAVLEGDLAMVKRLVESGTDVDTPDEFGWTPTCWAVSTGREEVAKYLLNQGADVSAKIEKGRTILHQASRTGLLEIVKSLIDKDAEVDAKCDAGATALQYAALSGQEAIVKLLIANGASINFTAKDGTHPLGDAARSGHENVVKLLLASGAQVNLQPEDKMMCGTALHAATAGAHSTIIDILIAHGADVNAVYKGGTPLTLAVNSFDSRTRAIDIRRSQIVQKLLKHGADIDAKHPRSGATPLYDALDLGRYRTAEVLIAAGANVNATNNEGKTLLALAKQAGHSEIVELLRKHGAKE